MIEDNFLKNKNTPILDPPKATEAQTHNALALVMTTAHIGRTC